MNRCSSYILLGLLIATAVVVVIYYRNDVTNKVTRSVYWEQRQRETVNDSNGRWNTTSCVTGIPCTYSDVVDFRVIVITFNRADSLTKLLRSLNTLVLDGDSAALEIWIDRDRKNGIDQRTLEVASTFHWTAGPTRVHVQVGYTSSFVSRGIIL